VQALEMTTGAFAIQSEWMVNSAIMFFCYSANRIESRGNALFCMAGWLEQAMKRRYGALRHLRLMPKSELY
jgi:hypothetical protein